MAVGDPLRLRAEAARLLENITPGEWFANNPAVRWRVLSRLTNGEVHYVLEEFTTGHEVRREADAKFIAAAPRLMRDLLAWVDTLSTARDELDATLGRHLQLVADLQRSKAEAWAERDTLIQRLAEGEHGWQPIATAPKDEPVFFWVVPKTAEESLLDTSGNSIFSAGAPHRHLGKWGTWGALWKPTHWRPLPAPPVEGS